MGKKAPATKTLTKPAKKRLLLKNQLRRELKDIAKGLKIKLEKKEKDDSIIDKISPKLNKTSMKKLCDKDPELAKLILKNFFEDEMLHTKADESQSKLKSQDAKNKARLDAILKNYF